VSVKGKGAACGDAVSFPTAAGMMDKHILTMKLLGLLAEFEQIVGRDKAIKLAMVCGGTSVYMPKNVHPEHWIAQAIGIDAARTLTAHFKYGANLTVPTAPRAIRIQALTEAGASAREIALTLHIHQRTVHRARQRGKHRHDGA